jgi:hypothetical protein
VPGQSEVDESPARESFAFAFAFAFACDNFLYGFKGAPSARRA